MSADNWAECPRCIHRAVKEKERKVQECKDAYGKVPAEEYLSMLKESEKGINVGTLLREDYGFGMGDDGEFVARYSAACQSEICGFHFEFEHREIVPIEDSSKKKKGMK